MQKRWALVRGSGLSRAELEFLKFAHDFDPVLAGPEATTESVILHAVGRAVGIRGGLTLSWLSDRGVQKLKTSDAIWIPDPWLPLSIHAARIARRIRKPYVLTVWENSISHPSLLVPPWKAATAWVLRNAEAVHCVSQGALEYVAELGASGRHVFQVYPGVDLQEFHFAPPLPSPVPYRFLFVGRLVPEKGVPELLKAFETAARMAAGIQLWVVGDGPLQHAVDEMARTTPGLAALGPVPREELPKILHQCHTLVLPSIPRKRGPFTIWQEQFGFVLVEAMAAGLDVIATSCGAIPEVVGSAGVVIGTERLESNLAKALVAASESRSEWLDRARRARERAQDTFDAAVNASRLFSNFEEALGWR